ncbi:MAG TPA: excinuclease ABC subunit UvrA [bacterium]|nr:excinuclease ABC subunit UvrA [bacterium]
MSNDIEIIGARTHNLKNISITIPRNQLVVITGVSGSGKSSLAFDTLYAEGQRRYVESLSAYARQFMERMDRPDVDEIHGISPAVAIEQKNTNQSSRSTVGTATEIQDYLRLLFARVGKAWCPHCGQPVRREQVGDVVAYLQGLPAGTRCVITFPHAADAASRQHLRQKGYFRIWEAGEIRPMEALGEEVARANIIVDRLVTAPESTNRVADSAQQAFEMGKGHLDLFFSDGPSHPFSQGYECARCGLVLADPQPGLFSFNHATGACPVCNGFGDIITIDEELVVPHPEKSIAAGCIAPWNTPTHRELRELLLREAPLHSIDIDTPYAELAPEARRFLWEGAGDFPGITAFFNWLETKKYKIGVRVFLSRYRGYVTCTACHGSRLRPEALNFRIEDATIADLNRRSLRDLQSFFNTLVLSEFETAVAGQILTELCNRLSYLNTIGMGYLTLDRRTGTLSGGEFQRINLATALGAQLVGSLYILDEPTIGLHPRDSEKLVEILKALRDIGNTVVVVEHDREMMRHADQIIDLGPGAGENGGEVIFCGSYDAIRIDGRSLTGAYLRGNKRIPLPDRRRPLTGPTLQIRGASEHNLKNIDLDIPLGVMVVVTGVSGSGKSTLVRDVLYAGLLKKRGEWKKRVGRFRSLSGDSYIGEVVMVDQSPIGRTPRSNPATYVKAFDPIRQLFAETHRARVRGLKSGAFSFNVPGGRCETCEGAGMVRVEMQFLADLFLECESCGGKRYRRDILDVRYHGRNISEVLEMTVSEALEFFAHEQAVTRRLKLLKEVGLGYLKLGQPATTLSGGEAQRVKLAAHLGELRHKQLLYIFDEPTTGLHFDDVATLLHCFNALIAAGHSVLIIEHNLDVIKCADFLIDLGPEGGEKGGYIVAQGTPEEVAAAETSYTAAWLKPLLEKP